MSSLDYSRFDNISDSEDEDSDLKADEEVRKTAWGPLEQLKKVADGLFELAEKDSSLESYKRALQHYDELLPRIQELQRADPDNLDKGYHMTVSCHLNACCCFMRAKRWSEANERCCLVLATSLAKGHNLTPIEEMRTRYFRIMSAIPLLEQHTKIMEQYKAMGIGNVNDHEANQCFEALQDDGEELAKLLIGGHVSTKEQQQYVDALEMAHSACENFGDDPDAPSREPQTDHSHHQPPPANENLDYDFSHTSPDATVGKFKMQRDQALTQAAKSYREGQMEFSLRLYEDALTASTNVRVNVKIALKKEQRDGRGGGGGSSPYQELAVENERIAGAAGTGKGACLVKLGKLEQALPPLLKAAKALVGLRDDKAKAANNNNKGSNASDKKHLWTCLESLSECYSRLKRWEEALETADRILQVFRSDKPNGKVAGMLLSRAHMLTSLQESRVAASSDGANADDGKYDTSAEAVAQSWQSAGNAFKDLQAYSDAHAAFCKAGRTLSAPGVAVSPGGIVAFSDLLTFPESSADVVDSDLAEFAHANWSSAAREAGKLADALLLSLHTTGTEGKVEHRRAVLHALHDQLQAWFEAGLSGMCTTAPALALRAFEAAATARDRYEGELAAACSAGMKEADLVGGMSGQAALFLNLGDLSFHFGHAYIRAGADKHAYAGEEALSAISFYDKAESEHGADSADVGHRRRLALSLQALALTFLGQYAEADAVIDSIGESFASGPGSGSGEEQMAAVRRMIAKRCPRSREREGAGAGAGGKPTPVVGAAKPPSARKAMYTRAVRALDAFLSFMTGDHWTSVLAAWLLVILTALCIALLIAASAGIVTQDTQDL